MRDTLYGSFDKPIMREMEAFDKPIMRDTVGSFDKPIMRHPVWKL